jgi:hypothetical protein
MAIFKKEVEKKHIPARIKNLDRSSLLTWFDNGIMSLGAGFDKWRFHGAKPVEVEEALEALTLIWYELQQRVDETGKH